MRGISSGRQRHVGPGSAINIPQLLAEVIKLDRDTLAQFERLRRMRNNIVHGVELRDPNDLREAARQLEVILRKVHKATSNS